jgi:hypothetical protein
VVDDPNDADDEVPTASFAIGWFPARTHVNWYKPVAVNLRSPVDVENAETVAAP